MVSIENPWKTCYPKAMITENIQIEVEFKIHGTGNLHGDGMAIWVTEDRASPGPVFGHKDYFKGLGVFIDTYKNHRPGTVFPYVMAMLGNGTESYDKDNDGLAGELAGCSVRSPYFCSNRAHYGIRTTHDCSTGERTPWRLGAYKDPPDVLPRTVVQG